MREIVRFVLELDLNEGKEFEKESKRLKISKIDLFRLLWIKYKEKELQEGNRKKATTP